MKTVLLPSTPLSSRLSINFSVPQANLNEITQALTGQTLLKGNGAINASISFTTSRGLPSLTGKGSLTSSQVETAFSILPSSLPLVAGVLATDRFDRLFLSFQARDGSLDVEKFSLEAPRLSLSGSGTVDLNERTIDASGSVEMAGSSALPVRLTGDLRSPRYSLEEKSSVSTYTLSPSAIELDLKFPRQLQDIINRH